MPVQATVGRCSNAPSLSVASRKRSELITMRLAAWLSRWSAILGDYVRMGSRVAPRMLLYMSRARAPAAHSCVSRQTE